MTRLPLRIRRDADELDALLAERDRLGTSLAQLSRRSGIPVGTLASRNARRRKQAQLSRFVAVSVRPGKASDDQGDELGGERGASQHGIELTSPTGWRVSLRCRLGAAELVDLLTGIDRPC